MHVTGQCHASSGRAAGGVLVDGVKVVRINGLRTWGLIAVAAGATGPSVILAAPDGPVVPRTSIRLLHEVKPTPAVSSSPSSVPVVELPQPIDASEIIPVSTSSGTAGTPVTRVYRNVVAPIESYYVPNANQRMADDLTLANGPCNLVSYILAVYASSGAYNVHTELWTDDPCLPNATAIADTAADFNLPATPVGVRQLVVNITGPAIPIPARVWLAATFSTSEAGWIIAGQAEIGSTQNYFSRNDPVPNPDVCTSGLTLPDTYAGFWAEVFCEGSPPTGACCNDIHGTCTDGVVEEYCVGRWMQDVTCASNPFPTPCGAHACCYPNPVNPNAPPVCEDLTPEECAALESPGYSAPGHFCANVTCPILACINRDGDCSDQHGTPGCDNGFCCEKVCTADPSCCSMDWDSACVNRALTKCSSDHCGDARPITGTGTFAFDNTSATTDGPVHDACATDDAPEKQIEKDVWYCWTASCTDTVFVRTCGLTTVDTKLAVYDGCACPPGDAALLDCGDDRCGTAESTAVFHAVAGRNYLIRLGNYPGQSPGTGSFTIGCGPPNQTACPGTGVCCTENPEQVRGCVDEACCERVCGCDSFCCETTWDADCAGGGYQNSGCGADVLCPALCGNCLPNTVTFDSPPPGILDGARPFPPSDATKRLGIDTIQVTAPAGGNLLGCWSLCETASYGPANGIAEITDDGGGLFTIALARPITTGAVTKITYAGNGTFARYIAHPANLNLDGLANTTDVDALVSALKGETPFSAGLLNGDVNRSGAITGADILDAVGLLIGESQYTIWNNSPKPVPNVNCP